MFDVKSREIIESLRSGVPSRTVAAYFSEARPELLRQLSDKLDHICQTDTSEGLIISGKYGEGKTHLLNTIFHMAQMNNMVVSMISLGKETPADKLLTIYQKIASSTYLPGREQPGFIHVLNDLSINHPAITDTLLYAAKELETDKLYYLLSAFYQTEDPDEKFLLQADIEGDLISNADLKRIYRRVFNKAAKFNTPFSKTKHTMDYFSFLSHLFHALGYNGWVILFDELELAGRLGKKARQKAYQNVYAFVNPGNRLEKTFSLFAISASYAEDVITKKHEYENLEALYPDNKTPGQTVLNMICNAQQLVPLTNQEIERILQQIAQFHFQSYQWHADIPIDRLVSAAMTGGYLLRTRIRAAIEYLDQLYQYGSAGAIMAEALADETYAEEDDVTPSLDDLSLEGCSIEE